MPHSSWNSPLAHGEHTAFGNAKRRDISGPHGHLAKLQEFEGHSTRAFWAKGGEVFKGGPVIPCRYIVMSYSTAIAAYRPDNNTIYLNEYEYSNKTTEHQHAAAAWLNHPHDGPVVVCEDENDLFTVSRED